MATTFQTNQLLDRARQVRAWDEARFAEIVTDESALPEDPVVCAEWLVSQGLLTRFQAKYLLAGKGKSLLLGSYRILEPIGSQDGKPLYLGEHTGLKRRVVIKMLPVDQADDQLSRERFLREARSAAALDHPNIARLFDICQDNSVPFLILEHLEGSELTDILKKKKQLPVVEAVQIVLQAARGLAHAHERGIVHRDMKPDNLFLTSQGIVKIKNLGLARSIQNEADNVTGVLGGGSLISSAEYHSPEQIMSEPLDQSTDVYSLGATLYTLIVGTTAYSGSLMQIIQQQQSRMPPRLSEARPNIPKELDEIVAKMMAHQREHRYADAGEVVKVLSGSEKPAKASRADTKLAKLAALSQVKTKKPTKHGSVRPHQKGTNRAKTVLIACGLAVAGVLVAIGGYLLVKLFLAS